MELLTSGHYVIPEMCFLFLYEETGAKRIESLQNSSFYMRYCCHVCRKTDIKINIIRVFVQLRP